MSVTVRVESRKFPLTAGGGRIGVFPRSCPRGEWQPLMYGKCMESPPNWDDPDSFYQACSFFAGCVVRDSKVAFVSCNAIEWRYEELQGVMVVWESIPWN